MLRFGIFRILVFAAAFSGLLAVGQSMFGAGPVVQAQSLAPRDSYIDPFPKDDVYRLHVVGDWYADGLQDEIEEVFNGHARVRVEGGVVSLKSLRRSAWDKEITRVDE
ncbi:MAG TPA: hypothetical protein VMX97_09215, partial [Hyphomicrobiaceae bacterium]|nr:hypothetical protein [Hyphomicrobiaceae bacterium]